MSERCIGHAVRGIYTQLSKNLAGPFEAFLPRVWIEEALAELDYRFYHSAFSPLGHALGLPRTSA